MSSIHPAIITRLSTDTVRRAGPVHPAAARTSEPAPRRWRWRLSRRRGRVEHRPSRASWLPTVPAGSSDAVMQYLVLGSLHTRIR